MEKLLGKKRLLNLIELGIQVLFFISTFLFQSVIAYKTSYSSNVTTNSTVKTSILGLNYLQEGNLLIYIFLILMGINALLCLISIFGNSTDKDGKTHIAIPIIILFFVYLVLYCPVAPSGFKSVEISSAYQIFGVICTLLMITLAIIKRTGLVIPKQSQQIINNITETTTADELKKYKDLLDSGVITQEEFDAKKKQLLGINENQETSREKTYKCPHCDKAVYFGQTMCKNCGQKFDWSKLN